MTDRQTAQIVSVVAPAHQPHARVPARPRIAGNAQTRSAAAHRLGLVREALAHADLAAVVCSLPSNVLLVSGYWPTVGAACAVVWREGPVLVLAPEDEQAAARRGWADEIRTLTPDPGNLTREIAAAAGRWGGARIAVECGPSYEPASYVGMCLCGASLWNATRAAWPDAEVVSADDLMANLRATKTAHDVARIAAACAIAEHGFAAARNVLRPGLSERAIAARVRTQFSIRGPSAARGDGFAFCMSGQNAADAYRAYARSTGKRVTPGELVLVHANSYLDGSWTDITRTYCMGQPDDRQRELYGIVFQARRAALDAIRPGVSGRSVDDAARQVLESHGLAAAYKHSTGHGVGFAAIDHNARPRLAPGSPDVLEAGMVCNVEPAVYFDGYGGIRHCDVVAVTDTGARVLTPFQTRIEDLIVA